MANLDAPKSSHHIRGSVLLLVLRIAGLLFLIETIFALFIWIALSSNIAQSYYNIVLSTLLFGHTVKFVFELGAIGAAIFPWAVTQYYLSQHQLIKYVGFLHSDEKFYELGDVRSIELRQSWLGKIVNYGTITINFSSSGFHEIVHMNGIYDPKKYERILRQYLVQDSTLPSEEEEDTTSQ
jgi:predicted membrane protein